MGKHLHKLLVLAGLLLMISSSCQGQVASGTWNTANSCAVVTVGNVTATTGSFGPEVLTPTCGASDMWGNGLVDPDFPTAYTNGGYFEYDITPTAGYTLTVTALSYKLKISSSTPTAAVYYSTDGWATKTQTPIGNIAVPTVLTTYNETPSITVPFGVTLSVRVYCFLAGAGKNLHVQDMIISGTTAAAGCVSPTTQASAMGSNTITSNSMNVTWTSGNGTAGRIVLASTSPIVTDPISGVSYTANAAYGAGTAIGSAFVVYNGAAATVAVSGLSTLTTYYFAVYEYNTVGTCYKTPSLSGNYTTTGCTATLPYIENFESAWTTASTLVTPGCAWSSNGAGNDQWQREDDVTGWTSGFGSYAPSGANSTSHSARFHSYDAASGTTGDFITPIIDCSAAGAKTLTFYYTNADGTDVMNVYLSTNGGVSYGASLGTYTTGAWAQYTISLAGATTATCKLKFTATSDYGISDIGLDEINITAPCVVPANQANTFSATAITGSSMTANWVRGIPNGNNVIVLCAAGAPVNTNPATGVAYTANAAYGSGTAIGNAFVVYQAGGTSVNVTGLSGTTAYYFAIYEANSAGPCYHTPALTGNATTTGCSTTLPFLEQFESAWTVPSTCLVPACSWACPQTGDERWQREDYTSGWSLTSGGAYAPSGANATSHSARFHSYGAANGQTGDMISPTLDCSAGGSKTLTFWYVNPDGSDVLNVYLSTDGGATYGASLKSLGVVANWTQYTVVMAGATTATCKIKFTATSDYGVTDIGIDEINVTGGACAPPAMVATGFSATSIAGSTMTLNWGLNGGTNVLILAAPAAVPNTNPTSGTTYTANANYGSGTALGNAYVIYDGTGTTMNLTGLSLSTVYDFIIYEYTPGTMCYRTATYLSGTATTLGTCTSPLPYNQHFDVAWTVPSTLPACTWSCPQAGDDLWHRDDDAVGWTSGLGNYAPTGALSTAHSARFHSYDAALGTTGDLISPLIDFTPAGNKTLTFWYNNADGTDVVNVYLSTNGGVAWGASLLKVTTTSGWVQYTVPLGASTNNNCQIKFTATSDYGISDIGIDEINISVATCTPPTTQSTTLSFTATSNVATTINWAPGNGDHHLVVVQAGGAVNSNPVSGTAYTANTAFGSGTQIGAGNYVVYNGTGSTVTMTGLLPNHTYYVAIYDFFTATDCYQTLNPLTGNVTTAAAVVSVTSDIISGGGESATVTSLAASNPAGPLTSAQGTQIWTLTIRDGGASAPDADALPTIVTGITVVPDPSSINEVFDWSATIRSIDLFDGATHLAQGIVTTSPNQIVFGGFTSTAADNGTKTLQIRVSMNCGIGTTGSLAGQAFDLNVTNLTAAVQSSATSSQLGTFNSVSASAQNVISVVQTQLVFTTQPSNASQNVAMAPAVTVAAEDACGNVATSFNGNITITSTGTIGGTLTVAAVNGVATFSNLVHSVAGAGLTLTATCAGPLSITSTTFNIVGAGPTYLVDEEFTNTTSDANIPTTTQGFTATAGWISYTSGSFNYGRNANALKFTASGTLTTPTFAAGADLVSFWMKCPSVGTSTMTVQEFYTGAWHNTAAPAVGNQGGDGETNPIADIRTSPRQYFVPLNALSTKVQFVFAYGGTVYFDDVMVRAAGKCTTGPSIESILVHSCVDMPEGVNEYITFSAGTTPINVSDLIVTVPSVQNGGCSFCAACGTIYVPNAADIATINTNSGCGAVAGCPVALAPPGGVIPAGGEVIVFMGASPTYMGYNFAANLATGWPYYVLFVNNADALGRFSNGPPDNRYIGVQDHATGCYDQVFYDSRIPATTGELAMFDGVTRALSYYATGCGAAAAILPVELLSFTGKRVDNAVNLSWSTASETNNAYYTLLRSLDGEKFIAIGQVKGVGNSSTNQNYSFVDEQAPEGTCYYQLKQTDFNGGVNALKTIAIAPMNSFVVTGVFPNPTHDELNVIVNVEGESTLQVNISDMIGKQWSNFNTTRNGNGNTLTMDLESLPSGIYLLSVTDESGKTFKSKFIKN